MKYKPKEIPEGVNVTTVHPLVDLTYLVGTVVIVSLLIYSILGGIASKLAVHLSPEIEQKIGQELISGTPNLVSPVPERQEYLNNLLASLTDSFVSNSNLLAIHVQENSDANAFILPGGQIILTTTLLQEAKSENELAFVLAHELGHHVAKDNLKGLGRSLVLLTVASVIGIGSGNTNLVTLTGSLSNLHYSRQQESAADLYALKTVIRHYGHGGASLDFFQRIQAKNKGNHTKVLGYFSSHPFTEERIETLEEFAQQKRWNLTGKPSQLPLDWQNWWQN